MLTHRPTYTTRNGSFHIGKRIKAVFDESGMTVVELARRLHRERSTVYSIFERRNIDVELLVAVCEALQHNFFDDIMRHFGMSSYDVGLDFHIRVSSSKDEEVKKITTALKDLWKCSEKPTET